MADLAAVSDVIARWRPLSTEETEVATILVHDASVKIRRRFPDIDTRITADNALPNPTLADTAKAVVASMVRRAMMNRDSEGVVKQDFTTGPFGSGATFANPSNNLYLSGSEITDLEPDGYSPPRAKVGWLA